MSSTRARKIWRVLAGIAGVLILLPVLVYAYWYIHVAYQDHDDFDRRAARQIRRLCGSREDCVVSPRDLVPGNWDTLDILPLGASSEEIGRLLGDSWSDSDSYFKRTVLRRQGKVVSVETSYEGVEASLADTVFFDCDWHENGLVSCRPDDKLRVVRGYTEGDPAEGIAIGGPTYTLQPIR